MGKNCPDDHYWDSLVNKCVNCQLVCRDRVHAKCVNYCDAAKCKAIHGHYFDILVKKCLKCAEICGRHPAECSQHCQTLPTPMITKKLLAPQVSTHVPTGLEDSAILIYSLLAMCLVLLFSSLSLALVVLVRVRKDKTSNQASMKGTNQRQRCVVQSGPDLPSSQLGKSSNVYYPTNREPSDDATPTETCVCVHCFPDLKALGQGNDKPLREPFSFYQQTVLHQAQIQNVDPLCTEENLHNSSSEVRAEAAVG